METSSSVDAPEAKITFESLPDVVLGKIMSSLHWKEKQLLAIASSRMCALLDTPLAWERFENNRNYAFHNLFKFMQFSFLLEQEIEVVRRYGKYFQGCKLWLYSMDVDIPQRNNRKWDSGESILKSVSVNCKQLKWLCVVHPSDTTFAHLQHGTDYIESLQGVLSGQKKRCSLSLRNLFYSSIDLSNSVIDNYLTLLASASLVKNVSCLDISHGLISDKSLSPAYTLRLCSNVIVLKCPIQVVNTNIIMELCKQKLSSLYLVSDEHTRDLGFWEESFLDWLKISGRVGFRTKAKSRFEVHYIFQNRAIEPSDLVFNPFTKSVILNNLTCGISASLLRAIADNYASSIENLAFCSNYWEFLMHFTDLHEINSSMAYVGRACVVLKSFISCLKLPSSALLSLAATSRSVMHVHVYKENVRLSPDDQPVERFNEKMLGLLGRRRSSWQMVKPGENIFDIPTIDPILFDTCFREF